MKNVFIKTKNVKRLIALLDEVQKLPPNIPIVRNWVTGKDVHTQLDVMISREWLKNELWKY